MNEAGAKGPVATVGVHDPTALEYFDALPSGWSSFPTCVVRKALVGGLHERGVLARDALPPRLRPLLAIAAGAGEWLPEVVHVATLLAVRDVNFGRGARANDEFIAWTAQLNRELFTAQLQTLGIARPADVLGQSPPMWERFHRGTPFTVEEQGANHARVVIEHPRALFAPLSIESHRRAMVVLLSMAGAVLPEATVTTEALEASEHARSRFHADWR